MAGHSKWKNIRDRKGAQDARRGKVFSKIIKEITVAVKLSGPEADSNPRLRAALVNARTANMSKDTVDRAIKKAMGAESENYSEITYECYGPGGVAIFVECTTDNPTRTVSNVRSYLNKYNGSLGKDGCLQFVFSRKGVFTIRPAGFDEDEFTLAMIDSGAEDVEFDEDAITVTTAMEDFSSVQKKLAEMKIEPQESGLQRLPQDTKKVTDLETFQTIMKLIERLEDDDDVQTVYHNLEYDEELMKTL